MVVNVVFDLDNDGDASNITAQRELPVGGWFDATMKFSAFSNNKRQSSTNKEQTGKTEITVRCVNNQMEVFFLHEMCSLEPHFPLMYLKAVPMMVLCIDII